MGYLPEEIQSNILSYVPGESVLEFKVVSKTWNSLLSHRKTAKAGLLISRSDNSFWKPEVKLSFGYYDEILSLTRVQERLSYDEIISLLTGVRNRFLFERVEDPGVRNRFLFDRVEDRDDNECLYKTLTDIKVRRSLGNVPMMSNLIGSCNGLVCLFVQDDGAPIFHIFNPFTGECFDLPTIYNVEDYIVMGFGYNPSSSNYKIVRILYPGGIQKDQKNKGLVQIYTLGGDSSGWRNVGEIIKYVLELNGVLWNGFIHWLACDPNQSSNRLKIAAFNLAEEEFRYLNAPPALGHSMYRWSQLTLLGGYLSIFNIDRIYRRTYIWSFKKKQRDDLAVKEGYNPSWDWILEFSIPFFPKHKNDNDYFEDTPRQDIYEPIFLTANNEVFLLYKTTMCRGGNGKPIILCRYDPKTDSLIKVMHWGDGDVTAFPHVNSFVSLKDMGVDSKTTGFAAECGSSLRSGCMVATTCAADCAENKLQI